MLDTRLSQMPVAQMSNEAVKLRERMSTMGSVLCSARTYFGSPAAGYLDLQHVGVLWSDEKMLGMNMS